MYKRVLDVQSEMFETDSGYTSSACELTSKNLFFKQLLRRTLTLKCYKYICTLYIFPYRFPSFAAWRQNAMYLRALQH